MGPVGEKLPWNLKITQLKRKIIFQTSTFGFQLLVFQGVYRRNPGKEIEANCEKISEDENQQQQQSTPLTKWDCWEAEVCVF